MQSSIFTKKSCEHMKGYLKGKKRCLPCTGGKLLAAALLGCALLLNDEPSNSAGIQVLPADLAKMSQLPHSVIVVHISTILPALIT